MSEEYLKAIIEIIKMGHSLTDLVNKGLKEYNISEPQFNVMRILKGRKGVAITVHEIQADMIQKSSNVTRIIDKLLQRDFVKREECVSNRRKMDISLTKTGSDFLEILNKKVIKIKLHLFP